MASRLTDESLYARRTQRLDAVGIAITIAALSVYSRRIGRLTGDESETDLATYEAQDADRVEQTFARGLALTAAVVASMWGTIPRDVDSWAAPARQAKGITTLTVDNPFTANALTVAEREVRKSTASIINTTVAKLQTTDGRLVPMGDAYHDAMRKAVASMRSGSATSEQSISEAVRTFSRSGLKVVYKSGATRDLYSAVSMNVMDSYRASVAQTQADVAADFGADGVEVSAHSHCSEDHVHYQGKQFDNKEWNHIQGSLSRPIAKGYNCRHTVTPILLGVMEPAYTAAQRKKMLDDSKRDTGFSPNNDGNTLNDYQFTQWQRRQETSIRKLRAEAVIMDNAGADAEDVRKHADKLVDRYTAASKAAKVPTRVERYSIYDVL